jgi:hypothetical protein
MEVTSLFAQLRASRSQRGAWTRSGQRDTSLNTLQPLPCRRSRAGPSARNIRSLPQHVIHKASNPLNGVVQASPSLRQVVPLGPQQAKKKASAVFRERPPFLSGSCL